MLLNDTAISNEILRRLIQSVPGIFLFIENMKELLSFESNINSIAHEQMRNDKNSFQSHYHLDKTTSELHYHSTDW